MSRKWFNLTKLMPFAKILTVVAVSTQVMNSSVYVPNSVQAAQANGRFQVVGSKIYDPSGKEFVVKGVNMFEWQGEGQFDKIASCWRFNTIRVPIYLLGSYGQPHPKSNNYSRMDAIVKKFTAKKMVVIFDAHDRIGSYYEGKDFETQKEFWREAARRYKGNPYVWFDLHNEPDDANLDVNKWVSKHQEMIRIIRDDQKADNVILVEGGAWGQDQRSYAIPNHGKKVVQFNGKTYANVAFSIHVYEQWNNKDSELGKYFDKVKGQNLALVIGEYGSKNNVSTASATRSVFNHVTPRKIGRIAWVWEASDSNDLTKTNGGHGSSVNNCQNPTNLTELGQLTWKDLRRSE